MKGLTILTFSILTATSGIAYTETIATKDKTILLPHVRVIRGKHCESSAITNALKYLGYEFSEAMVAGGGGAPAFAFQKSSFPFVGGRCSNMREVFFRGAGIAWHVKQPSKNDSPWAKIAVILKQGIPVILRVDMRYLPYLFGGQYGPEYMSFGWHIITLFGIDYQKGIGLVSDTEQKGLQWISLKDLEKARFSETRMFPPQGEYFWIEKKPKNYKLSWKRFFENAIKNVITNMEQTKTPDNPYFSADLGLDGFKNLGKEIMAIEHTVNNTFMVPMVLNFWYGCIETNGTGGAAFRILFRDFLLEADKHLKEISLEQLIGTVNSSIKAWHNLAEGFKNTASTFGALENQKMRNLAYKKLADLAYVVYQREKNLHEILKTTL